MPHHPPPSVSKVDGCAWAEAGRRPTAVFFGVHAPPPPFTCAPPSPLLPPPTGEVLLGDLSSAVFDLIDDPADADAIVVNTCAFVEDAKSQSLEAILEASSLRGVNGKKKKVVVTGCLAQRYGADLAASLPEADLVVGFQHYGGLAASLGDVVAGRQPPKEQRVRVGDATVPFRPEARRARLTPKHTAYLRVAEGCSHACTFCAIPGFR